MLTTRHSIPIMRPNQKDCMNRHFFLWPKPFPQEDGNQCGNGELKRCALTKKKQENTTGTRQKPTVTQNSSDSRNKWEIQRGNQNEAQAGRARNVEEARPFASVSSANRTETRNKEKQVKPNAAVKQRGYTHSKSRSTFLSHARPFCLFRISSSKTVRTLVAVPYYQKLRKRTGNDEETKIIF